MCIQSGGSGLKSGFTIGERGVDYVGSKSSKCQTRREPVSDARLGIAQPVTERPGILRLDNLRSTDFQGSLTVEAQRAQEGMGHGHVPVNSYMDL